MNEVQIERRGDGSYRLTGNLTFETVPGVWARGNHSFGSDELLRLDLGGVGHTDSAGLALLIEWLRQARQRGQSIVFLNIPAQLCAIAKLSDLDELLPTEQAPST